MRRRRRQPEEKLGFSERLKAVRQRLGLRQLDVARELGIRRETLALIEVDYFASDRVRTLVREWLAAREAEIAAADAAAADRAAGLSRRMAAPFATVRQRPSGRRRSRPLAVPMMGGLVLRRRLARLNRKAEAEWEHNRRSEISTLRLVLLGRRRRPGPSTDTKGGESCRP